MVKSLFLLLSFAIQLIRNNRNDLKGCWLVKLNKEMTKGLKTITDIKRYLISFKVQRAWNTPEKNLRCSRVWWTVSFKGQTCTKLFSVAQCLTNGKKLDNWKEVHKSKMQFENNIKKYQADCKTLQTSNIKTYTHLQFSTRLERILKF